MAGSGLGLGQLARAIRMARAVRFRKGGGVGSCQEKAWQEHVSFFFPEKALFLAGDFKYFLFSPLPGEMGNLTNIFQMG